MAVAAPMKPEEGWTHEFVGTRDGFFPSLVILSFSDLVTLYDAMGQTRVNETTANLADKEARSSLHSLSNPASQEKIIMREHFLFLARFHPMFQVPA